MDGLRQIMGCESLDRIGDVVFVHGLDGDERSTWHPRDKPDDFWPAWLGSDLPNIGVWSLGYQVDSSAWKGHAMPLTYRATNTLAVLDAQQIGARSIVFVCHSLGGLLIKQMLRHARDLKESKWKAILKQTKGIVFLSTPHSGSNIASWVNYISKLLRSTVAVQELEAHNPPLLELNDWFRDNIEELRVRIQVYFEQLPTSGLLVVDATSANPGISGVKPIPLDEDHVSICKPASKASLQYVRVRQFIEECLEEWSMVRPFDGVLLSPRVEQAMVAIPQVLSEIQTRLSHQQPDLDVVRQEVEYLRRSIITFEDMGYWLEEAKMFHERLQSLSTALEPIRVEWLRATEENGQFDYQKYRISEVRKTWEATKRLALDGLLSDAQHIHRIENEPLVVDVVSNSFISGPRWCHYILELCSQIESSFALYDKKSPRDGKEREVYSTIDIANFFNELNRFVISHMHHLDQRIRREALDFAKETQRLAREIRYVQV